MKNTVKNARLREIRKQKAVTQQEIANYLNMSRGSYQYLESKGILTGDILIKLSRFFELPVEVILGTKNEPTRLQESTNTNVVHTVLSEDEKKILNLYKQLPYEEQLHLQGYLEGRIAALK